MMTKKSEMAEWILDFFRRANASAGQIVAFRSLQFAQRKLNPKEQTLFLNVMNELLEHGYFTFEQEPLQCLRLSEKGYNYIYDPDAVLDCCVDKQKTTEEDYRNIITLASILVSMEAYADLLNCGTAVELYNHLTTFDYTDRSVAPDLKVETTKEYYELIFKSVILTCRIVSNVTDDALLDIVNGYITQARRCLSSYNIIKVPAENRLTVLIQGTKERLRVIGRASMAENLENYCNMIFL